MIFKPSKEMKIEILDSQKNQISSKEKIKAALQQTQAIAFDIYNQDKLVGFAMLREYAPNEFFLWNFAIDKKYQNQGIGTKAIANLIDFMKTNYCCKKLTTTYKFGNDIAKRTYEKLGFTTTKIVNEYDIHEVDMELNF
ncbi:MAG: GNAT family N-acetyltransferase [Clostridia bacterium]|nr:GNAT family N-acetyltransferase [Clostridia bacterium]